MIQHVARLLPRAWLCVLVILVLPAKAQVYQTQALYSNPVSPRSTAANAFATPVSGSTFGPASRPTELNAGRFKIDNFQAGAPFSSAPPDYNFGDIIPPPPLTDLAKAPTIVTKNGAFYMASRKQVIAAQGGACTIQWPTLSGGTNSITYNIGSVPTLSASRLFWTDNYMTGAALNTNTTSLPDNTDYAVSLSGIYAKVHYNLAVPDFDAINSQDTAAGRALRSDNAIAHLDLPAVWIDRNSVLRARAQSGYFVLEYFDTPSYDNSVSYEIVYVGPAKVYQSQLVLGDRLLPSEGADVAARLQPFISKAGEYIVQWTASGSHFYNWIFASRVNSDASHPDGDSSKTQVLWQKKGNLQVVWPYEPHWYSITWPGDEAAKVFVFDPANPSRSPSVNIPTNYTATVVWSEAPDLIIKSDSATSTLRPVGEGRALIQYQNSADVWFVPVRVAARNNNAYFSDEETYWPVGLPLQPVVNRPRFQFSDNYLTFEAALHGGVTLEMWIKPNAITNNQTLAAFMDYPQQAGVQAALSLTNGFLQLVVLTDGTSGVTKVVSSAAITANTWSHVAFTKGANGLIKLYVNGALDNSMSVSRFNGQSPSASTYAQMIFGKSFTVGGSVISNLAPFSGEVREIRMWDAEHSANSIRTQMAWELAGDEESLAHLITPSWLESYTPAEGTDGSTFLTPDHVTGNLVEGYGTLNTSGLAPYPLVNRLRFNGSDNWVSFPFTWNRNDSRTIEFWLTPQKFQANRAVLALTTTTATNLHVGLQSNGGIVLGGASAANGPVLQTDVSYHIAVVTSGGAATLFVDGVARASVALPAGTTGTQALVGAGTTMSAPSLFEGEIEDFRIYSAALTADQIANDRISWPDFSDPDLIRCFDFDQITPATVNAQSVFEIPDRARGFVATYHGAASFGNAIPGRVQADVAGATVIAGTAYHVGIYTNESRVIPVNSTPAASTLEVWWHDSFTASYLSAPLAFPSVVSRYRLMDPLAPPALVVAGQDTQGYAIPSTWTDPQVYYQNDPALAGYNPNEEHALLVGSSLYALRWDLNRDETSHGYALLQYKDQERNSLSYLQPIQIIPTNSTYPNFNRSFEVGQLLQAPKPLTDLPPSALSGPAPNADPLFRLYKDRQNYWWARSAVSSGAPDFVVSRWFYPLQTGFYWPATLGVKAPGESVPFGNTSNALGINYTIRWPAVVPQLALGQSITDAAPSASGDGFLPAVTGQKSAEILYDEPKETSGKSSSVIIDPTQSSSADLANLNNLNTSTDVKLGKTYFTLLPPHLRERVFWDPQTKKLNLLGQIVRPVTGFPYLLPAWLGSVGNPNTDFSILENLSSAPAWKTAIGALRKNATIVPDAETPFDSIALSPTGLSGGYVTLGMNTRLKFNETGDPISLYPIFINTNLLFTGQVIAMFSANKFDEYTTLRHSGDFGGDPSQYQFEWRYSDSDQGQPPTSSPGTWTLYTPVTSGLNRIIFGGPGLQTLKDTYFAARWRCIAPGAPNGNWSDWTAPTLVESWLTRALDGINPFEQRVESLANNHVDLTTSILSQAGKRFVGSVPLNMDNVNDYGLIEIYETLLDRARLLSIDSGYSDVDVNASLLDAASKLNELYAMLGDEAYNDAKDPTIAWGTRDLNDMYFGSRASSLFAFQGIVPNLLEEELALLRGLDGTTSPVTTYPVYNRLYWNFTKGINSGEPAYALNYGIQSVTTNEVGSISEADAARWYPQGHGDAYGHYLTALTTYYRLLMNTNFTWSARAEAKSIGGVTVTFDYIDERKMASAALQRGRVGLDIIERTFRRDFRVDPSQRQPLFEDAIPERAWAASEWCDRVSQGVLYDWITLNSLLRAPTGGESSQTITRATVPELKQLAGLSASIQDIGDAIDRGDSPMQVAANVVPFDLDPSLVDSGVSHFEQIYGRAISAVQSAYTVLQQASVSAANLRRQNVSLETLRDQIARRESEFNSQLIDLYGTPYSDDIGATGSFVSGYNGPDLYHFNYIDRDLFSPDDAGAVTTVSFHTEYSVTGANMDTLTPVGANVSYSVNSDGIPVLPNSWTGRRAVYGKIQGALGDYIRAWVTLRGAVANQRQLTQELEARLQRLRDHNAYSATYGAIGDSLSAQKQAADLLQELSDNIVAFLDEEKEAAKEVADASSDATPQSFIAGLAAGGDLSFPARLGIGLGKVASFIGFTSAQGIANLSSYAAGKASTVLEDQIAANESDFQDAEYQSQTALETTILLSRANAARDSIYAAAIAFRQAWQNYQSLVSRGNQLQADVLAFRTGNASRIQEARYADIVFRIFRNEDLENYRNAFDQAARYTFAAARVYDYETGLLDPAIVSGRTGDFMGEVMTSRQLGDLVNGLPVPGAANAGSLVSVLDRMRANWATLKGRFGINNPTRETHSISLRQELFRIGNSANAAAQDANNTAWKNQLYTCKIPDIRQCAEFRNFCQPYSPMSASEPALVIPFSTEISAGRNVFGLPLAGGDTVFDPGHFTTKLRGATVSFVNYERNAGATLTKSPRVYLVPVGIDRQRTPISGGREIRDWHVIDQVWPIPYPSAAGNVNIPLESIGSDNMHVIRKFAPMRAYDDSYLASLGKVPYDTRLIGRSVWNTRWVLIIPASSLSSSTGAALDTFIESVGDIKLVLDTYSYSGN